MAVVTNVDFDKWGEYLSDGPLAMAFLDALHIAAVDAVMSNCFEAVDSAIDNCLP